MSTIEAQRNILFQEWTRPVKNIKTIESTLENLKLTLSQTSFHQDDIKVADLIMCRDVLEIGAFFSIETGLPDSFERYLSQLKVYYFDYQGIPGLPESANRYQLLGLNLLRLLSQNRLAEFHTVSTIKSNYDIAITRITFLLTCISCRNWSYLSQT